MDSRQPGQRLERPRGLHHHARAGEVAQLVEGAGLGRAAGADDRHAIAQRLDLSQDVAGEQDRAPRVAQLADDVLKDDLHQRIESGRRLIQQVELDVRRESRDERHLLAVALRVGAALLGGVQLEPLQQDVAPRPVERAAQRAEQVDDLAAGEVRPQVHLARHVCQATVQRNRITPRVAAEQRDDPGVPAQQAEQDADRGRLAGAIRPQEPVHLTRVH